MNYPNEELTMNNQINPNQNKITKYIKSLNYPQKNINIGKMTLKKQVIKQEKEKEKINPEIIEFKLKEKNLYINKPKPNLELYQKKENNQEQNKIFENNEIIKNDYLMPKHSIKSSNSFKINTKIKNKKYLNKNKIYDFPNDLDNINNNEYILAKNYSNKTNTKKFANFNLIPNNTTNLKMTKSSIQINGMEPLPQSNINNNQILSRITSIDLNLEGGNSPQKKFLKKNSYNKFEINKYIPTTFNNLSKNNKNINISNKYKGNLTKKDFNTNTNYNYKSDMKELKKNKINKNNNNDLMGLDNYNKEINFVQTNHEYNNIFFYSSKTNNEINTENYQKNRNNINYYSAKEKMKNKFIYKKTKSISKKEEIKKSNKIILTKKEIKNNIKNDYNIIDINIKLTNKIENISININKDNIKEKIEDIINKNDLNSSYYEPIYSLVNNSINILNNINKIKLSKIKNINELNDEILDENNLDYSIFLDLIEKNKFEEFIEKIYPDYYTINETKKILNMSI